MGYESESNVFFRQSPTTSSSRGYLRLTLWRFLVSCADVAISIHLFSGVHLLCIHIRNWPSSSVYITLCEGKYHCHDASSSDAYRRPHVSPIHDMLSMISSL